MNKFSNHHFRGYGIEEYLSDLIELGYSSNEIVDILKVGDIKLSKETKKELDRTVRSYNNERG